MIVYVDDAFKISKSIIFKQMQVKEQLETSRNSKVSRLTPIPEKLEPILELVRLIPPDVVLADLSKKFSRLISTSRMSEEKKHVAAHQVVASCLENLPETFRRHVWNGGKQSSDEGYEAQRMVDSIFINGLPQNSRRRLLEEFLNGDDDVLDDIYYGTIEDAVREYSFIRESREKLGRLIELTSYRTTLYSFMFPLASSGSIRVDQSGIVRISTDRFAEAVSAVDATLIRSCKVCQRVFWAGRRDKYACSETCAHVLRNRRYRKRYREGLYQGAVLTAKEKASLRTKQTKRTMKGR